MQSVYSIAKTIFGSPSVRPEFDAHSPDYNHQKTTAQPIVRTRDDATKKKVTPDRPAVSQELAAPKGMTTVPSYQTPLPPPAAYDRQQGAIASETTTLSTTPTSRYTAQTFVDAARSGCLDSVLRHIDAGLEVNVGPTPYAATPLMHAANLGHEAVVRQLLNAGACVNQAQRDGGTALMFAAQNGHTAVVEILLGEGASVDQTRTDNVTALMFAAQNGHTATVRALLAQGATVSQANAEGWTALMFAVQKKHAATVRELLAERGTVNQAKTDGWTSLMFATQNDHTDIVQLLLEAGPDCSLNN